MLDGGVDSCADGIQAVDETPINGDVAGFTGNRALGIGAVT